jgi:hypothetical protein
MKMPMDHRLIFAEDSHPCASIPTAAAFEAPGQAQPPPEASIPLQPSGGGNSGQHQLGFGHEIEWPAILTKQLESFGVFRGQT